MTGDCTACPKTNVRTWRGWCIACYAWQRRHGGDPKDRLRAPTRPWTDAERNMLIYSIGYEPAARIARKLHRTTYGVEKQSARLRLKPLTTAARINGMNTKEVAAAMGVSHASVVRWIHHGHLKAQRAYGLRRWVYSVDADDLYTFLCERGAACPLQPSSAWRPLVAQARAVFDARYISTAELVRVLAITFGALLKRQREMGFPPPAQTFGAPIGHFYERRAVRAWLEARPQFSTRAAREALGNG